MKQVVARAGEVVVQDVPRPVCPSNGVLVRTEWSVISTGTESWAIDSTEPVGATDMAKNSSLASKAYKLSRDVLRQEGVTGLKDYVESVRNPQLPLGYSSSGTVVEIGREVTDLVVGGKVACAGEAKASHAEYSAVPRNLVAKVPLGLQMRDAAFGTMGAIALHAVRTARLEVGETVGILGAGLVGNLVAQIARASGCKVLCSDLRDERLDLVRSMGVDATVKVDDPNLSARVSDFTNGVGLDHVLVCAASSSSEPVNVAAKLVRSRGQIVVVGRVGMEIDRKDFYQKELKLKMTRSLGPGRYDAKYEEKGLEYPIEYVRWTLNRNMAAFMDLVKDRRVNVEGLVGGDYPLASAPMAYASLSSQPKAALLLSYAAPEVGHEEHHETVIHIEPPKGGKIGVALVGPGAFAKETMIPLLRSSPNFSLRWLVSSSPVHAKQLQARYRFDASSCDIRDALSDKDVGLVVITAPNNLHFRMLSSAMRAGKVSLLEKPLCVTREEFDEIRRIQADTKLPVIVGFNRRYAPLVLEMKKRMTQMSGPFVLNYRVNAGFVSPTRWSQDPDLGGGRIIHECCHFFDLFNFLLGKGEPKINADSAGITGSNSVARDNLSVSLVYPDGSLANLLYVSMGGKSMERERIEVFGENHSFVLDDFKELRFYGDREDRISLPRLDKGHGNELNELARFLRGQKNSLIATEEVFRATDLTFKVDEAVRGQLSS